MIIVHRRIVPLLVRFQFLAVSPFGIPNPDTCNEEDCAQTGDIDDKRLACHHVKYLIKLLTRWIVAGVGTSRACAKKVLMDSDVVFAKLCVGLMWWLNLQVVGG